MKIAIANKPESFTRGWIRYCEDKKIPHKIVDVYKNDIVEQTKDCDIFMFHFFQFDYRDMIFAKSLLTSLEKAGKKVFPSTDTCWHFDDKIAQKYLLEAIDAPLVPTHIFYTEEEALDWAATTDFPKVFKLRGGAGSTNVKLAKTKNEAIKLIRKSFGNGFKQYRATELLREEYRKYKLGKSTLRDLLRPIYFMLKRYPTKFDQYHGKESGYAYFQDFIPGNDHDIRICIVGNRAFGFKRLTRKNDFRASGSGKIVYKKEELNEKCVEIAFEVNKRLNMQSVAYDFVFDKENRPFIVEISYGYVGHLYEKCEGYWTDDMQWHAGEGFDFYGWMIENLISSCKRE